MGSVDEWNWMIHPLKKDTIYVFLGVSWRSVYVDGCTCILIAKMLVNYGQRH